MISVKDSIFYKDVRKEINYDHGNLYIFDRFVISESNRGITYSWEEHAQPIINDIAEFLNTDGSDVIYISNRVNSYAVKPNDWLKFYKNNYKIKAYGVVAHTQGSTMNMVIENLFFSKKIKRFQTLESAVEWANNEVYEKINAYN